MILNLITEFTRSPQAVGGAALGGSHQRGGAGGELPSLRRCAAQGSRWPFQGQRPTAAILKSQGQGFCTRSAELNCWAQPFWEEELWSEASACSSLCASETRRNQKEKQKVRLYFTTQTLLSFPRSC